MQVLIVFCFILFLILCVWNVYLTMQLSRYKELEKSFLSIKQETEDVLYSFIEEWKEENEEFLNKLDKKSNNNMQGQKTVDIEKPIVLKDKKPTNMIHNQKNVNNDLLNETKNVSFDFKENETTIDYRDLLLTDQVLRSQDKIDNTKVIEERNEHEVTIKKKNVTKSNDLNNMDEIIKLQKEGYSIDEIAKRLNKGKTEIELMLKLRH